MLRLLKQLLRQDPHRALILVSIIAYATNGFLPAPLQMSTLCGGLSLEGAAEIGLLHLQSFPISRFAVAWFVMMATMMTPLLGSPLLHVWQSSIARSRPLSIASFIAAYLGMWTLAGVILVPLSTMLRASMSEGFALLAALTFALIWSHSPIAQAARNRCHALQRISAQELASVRDSLSFGARHALPCIYGCWPWMLVPMALAEYHLPLMAIVTAYLFLDRLEFAKTVRWRTPPGLALTKSLVRTDLLAMRNFTKRAMAR